MSTGPKSKLYQAISEIQNSEISLPKDAQGQVGSRTYDYLTINTLHSQVFPELKKYGLVWITLPEHIAGIPALGYELIHVESNEAISGVVPLCLAKQDPQALGSALTYARRYVLMSVLGLVGNDDDGAAGSAQAPVQAPAEARQVIPLIPSDRALSILTAAQEAGLAEGTELKPALQAKLTEVGVETLKLGHLNVDQAELVEAFIAAEGKA